ncbi:hypothetical protein BN1723_003022 [Verticillium longisporum]|uniref:Uncharacterized protein n=1 Tax=Verticillium longisporum TaxID=100787 RepID=A0A0G4LMM6_VERLO|nr:hypothetical protein BN1723_003022 [Verticillium longisporum]
MLPASPESTGTTVFSDGVLRSSRQPPTPPPSNVSTVDLGPLTPKLSIDSAVEGGNTKGKHRSLGPAPGDVINCSAQRLSLGAEGANPGGILVEDSIASSSSQDTVIVWLASIDREGDGLQDDGGSQQIEGFSLSELIWEAKKLSQSVII